MLIQFQALTNKANDGCQPKHWLPIPLRQKKTISLQDSRLHSYVIQHTSICFICFSSSTDIIQGLIWCFYRAKQKTRTVCNALCSAGWMSIGMHFELMKWQLGKATLLYWVYWSNSHGSTALNDNSSRMTFHVIWQLMRCAISVYMPIQVLCLRWQYMAFHQATYSFLEENTTYIISLDHASAMIPVSHYHLVLHHHTEYFLVSKLQVYTQIWDDSF